VVKVRNAAGCFLVLAMTGTGSAELLPQDPYPDVSPAQIEVDAISGVGGVPKPAPAKPSVAPASASISESKEVAEEWWEDQDLQLGGGIGFGLLVLAFAIRGRRRARRRASELANRRTQFGMSAVNPVLAQSKVAAWERGPAIVPAVINPEMLSSPHRMMSHVAVAPPVPSVVQAPAMMAGPPPGVAAAPIVTHEVAQPYHGYSRADLAAYGMGPQPPASLPPLPVSQPSFTPPSTPVIPPPVASASVAADLRRCHMPWASPAAQPMSFAPAQPSSAHGPAQPSSAYAPASSEYVPQPSFAAAQPSSSYAPASSAYAPASSAYAPQPSFAAAQPSFAPAQPSSSAFAPAQPWMGASHPAPAALPSHPGPFAAIGSQPAPYAAGIYAAAPSGPSGLARTSHPFAPIATQSQPAVALLQPASYAAAHAPSARRARLADGTPQPPITNPQPFVALPQPARHLVVTQFASHAPAAATHLTATQFASHAPAGPSHLAATNDSAATAHFAPAHLPASFVLEMSAANLPEQPAPYPLTFPAYPDSASTVLTDVEPSGLNYWGAPSQTEIDAVDIQFARGSQPVEQLDPIRIALPQAAPQDTETRIAPMPLAPADRRTYRH
jgi:hypothetical protein